MSHVIELSDDQYETLRKAAEARGESLAALLTTLVDELRDPLTQPRYYETEEWFRHLEDGDVDDDDSADADAR